MMVELFGCIIKFARTQIVGNTAIQRVHVSAHNLVGALSIKNHFDAVRRSELHHEVL